LCIGECGKSGKSDTPRTAAVLAKQPNGGFGLDKSQCIAQWYDHSSQLERELAEKTRLLEEASKAMEVALKTLPHVGGNDMSIYSLTKNLSEAIAAIKEQK
jgi:hypothetical protein